MELHANETTALVDLEPANLFDLSSCLSSSVVDRGEGASEGSDSVLVSHKASLGGAVGPTQVTPSLTKPLLDVSIYDLESQTAYSPLKLESFIVWLHGYDFARKQNLLDSIANGVRIPSTKVANDDEYELYNHFSALQHADFVREKIQSEISCNRVAGPFDVKPEGLIISPLSCVPKQGNTWRLVHNLSWPLQDSVNSGIDREFCRVEYETLDHCIDIIAKIGVGCVMSKCDVENAFRILKVNKSDYKFTGFSFDGKIYWDKNLPFGLSISCQVFEELSKAIQWILKEKLKVKYVSHILDDYMFFGVPHTNQCSNSLKAFLMLADSLGLPIKESKTFYPCTKLELHGITVCTETMTMSLPKEKVDKAIGLIKSMLSCSKTTVKQIQVITGLLNYCTKIVPSGRAFLRRLYDLTSGAKHQSHHVRVTCEVKSDLKVWLSFLLDFNCKVIITRDVWCHENVLHVYTDSSGTGYGGYYGSHWFNGHFPVSWTHVNIAIKEFVAAYLAWKLWFEQESNVWVEFHIDNQSVVFNLLNQTSYLQENMIMMREMVLVSLQRSIQFKATYIRSHLNFIADHLSRFQVHLAKKKAPFLNKYPDVIRPEWLPWNRLQ